MAVAEAETVHALKHLSNLKGIKDTKQNLEKSIAGEMHEFKTMYPEFSKEAQAEGNKAALASFQNAMTVEEVHAGLYTDAAKVLAEGGDMPDKTIYVCGVCGNTIIGEAPDKCPVCGAIKDKFEAVD